MHMRYSFTKNGEGFAFAQQYNVDASFKDLVQVCRAIKKMPVPKAMDLLGKVGRGEMPVEYRTYNKKIGHRRELGGRKGRYPAKAANIVRKVLANAINNAKVKQIDEATLVVEHACANKQDIYPRLAPKGRRMRANYETAKIEIAVKGEPRKIAEISVPATKKEAKKEAVKGEAEKVAEVAVPEKKEVKKKEAVKVAVPEKEESVSQKAAQFEKKEEVVKAEKGEVKRSEAGAAKPQNIPKKVNKSKTGKYE